MKAARSGHRVAVIGPSSLLGKELIAVLKERAFPVSRLVTFESDEDEPDLPIVDLRGESAPAVWDEDLTDAELDIAFLAAPSGKFPSFLRPSADGARPRQPDHCTVIDLGGVPESPDAVVRVPFLERAASRGHALGARPGVRWYVSAHPAAIVTSALLLRLAERVPVRNAVVHVFSPASEIGPRAIEELQKQTLNLLSFQKIPQTVFGNQLAFNLLPRLAGKRAQVAPLSDLETALRSQLRQYLNGRVSLPALRVFQAPIFNSVTISIYLETAQPVAPEALGQALAGERLQLRRLSEKAPSPVEVAGSTDILVDAITADPASPTGA